MKKTVILAMPHIYGFDQQIENNLRFHGFDVINLCYDDRDSRYPHFGCRLLSTYHKIVTKDKNYKKTLKYLPFQPDIRAKLASLGGRKADYALCIHSDIYPKEIIAQIREHSEVCVNYQWDGIGRFPEILQYLPYFDQCWVFDPEDVKRYPECRLKATTNFFFDLPVESSLPNDALYFLGGYESRREERTKLFIEEARRLCIPMDFHIYCKDDRARRVFGIDGITYLDRSTALSYEENMEKAKSAKAIVDFAQFDHYGLSFRVFDALRFEKKLITTNQTVADTDFYDPDNIFIWTSNTLDDLKDFFRRPYRPVPSEIKQQYSFKHWAYRLLGIPLQTAETE
ncbi:hypothetical protein [Neisseria chenwenguii]|uniref:Uncharacterized protein n=1 Tax=Neisseria chenwenguii TaxID=1853278 RepID=A0A220S0R6_9NEIS|nr:hypothetical protein [Neisseria chenwenguii]ASK27054.1 hypothetical protein BG910_04215 [Neisseria chenwenguii]ROV56046.1 hypothetical protein EGS38_06165 [Neisseria chenwenguii]